VIKAWLVLVALPFAIIALAFMVYAATAPKRT
jgi:uncharacterized membrane protein